MLESTTENKIEISDSAAKRVSFLLSKKEVGARLRISVIGGGCSGFQYKYEFDKNFDVKDDLIFKKDNAEVVIDQMSLDLIKGSVFDFVENLTGSYFEIKNPNATANCGCGNSFST